MLTDPGRVPLARRAWIGDGRHGASVAPDGTLDWYAPGGISAPPALWRLLDDAGPAVRVGPVRDAGGTRLHLPPADLHYRADTNVIEAVSEASGGRRVSVIDLLAWEGPGQSVTGRVVRLVRALSGPIDVEVEVLPGPERSRRPVQAGGGTLAWGDVAVTAPAPFEAAPLDRDTERWRSAFRLEAGEEAVVTIGSKAAGGLTVDRGLSVDAARRLLGDTEAAWQSWLATLAYDGPYRTAVARALLGVRALTTAGAPLGAGTTSLPRRVGSERSTDGRWVRVRDVARAARLYALAGFPEDAEAAEAWLRQALTTAHLPWPAWLDADGQPVPERQDLQIAGWRPEGWRRSGPVVTGRLTPPAVDVGLLGDVTAAIGSVAVGPFAKADDPGPLSAAYAALATAADHSAEHWRDMDNGRWEIADPLRPYTAGRIALWSAFDRLARIARAANPLDFQAVGWWAERADLFSWLEKSCVTPDGGLGLAPGDDEADAALLPVAWSGPWPATHPVVVATVERTLERLGSGPFLYRYSDRVADGMAGPDNPDVEASLLAVKALARLGRWDEAHDRMEAVVALAQGAGPGLLGETIDAVAGQMFGNLPCTAAGLALVDAALALRSGPL